MPKDEATFEEKFAELEAIVEEFESQELELESALEKFERGLQLSQELQEYLETAENKIEELKSESNAAVEAEQAEEEAE